MSHVERPHLVVHKTRCALVKRLERLMETNQIRLLLKWKIRNLDKQLEHRKKI